ncbi:MAG: hypothetical protein JSS86_04980 [Cyanobacteria bacterium SZAS LIN-2]|nr:hypothetical protein [Cyanobacteria bacterium SZAS LIN-2]
MSLRRSANCTAFGLLAAIAALTVNSQIAQADNSPVMKAYNLYNQKQYAASADAYESIIRTATPEPRLYYYAALANRGAGRAARARQLFEYIGKNFSSTPEGALSQTALGLSPAAQATATGAASAQAPNAAAPEASASTASSRPARNRVKGAIAFSTEEIAKEGANAIDQSRYPNCWFEASMSALAQLPRGQRLLANMIHYGDGDKYVVRFPGDGKEYIVSEADCEAAGITNRALWASLLECAQIRKFPNNQGAGGAYDDQSRLEVGMGCITGNKAEIMMLNDQTSPSELSSFIGGAVRSGNPIIAGTKGDSQIRDLPELVFGAHAYTIIGIDQSRNMVTVRNPHGAGSRQFHYDEGPSHLKFEQKGDGIFKMSLDLFPKYFHSMARSFI